MSKITTRNYLSAVPLFMLTLSVFLILPLYATTASGANIDLLNARHKVSMAYPYSRRVNGVNIVRGNRPFRANVNIDLQRSRMANLNDYKMVQVLIVMFKPGYTAYGPGSYVVANWKGNSAPKRALSVRMNFKTACGVRGAFTTIVSFRHKTTGQYLSMHQGSRPSPWGGGLVPVQVDCAFPAITQLGRGRGYRDNSCFTLDPGQPLNLEVHANDDVKLTSITLRSSSSGIRISPANVNGSALRNSYTSTRKGNKHYKALFVLRRSRAIPENVTLYVGAHDLAGFTSRRTMRMNFKGTGASTTQVRLNKLPRVMALRSTLYVFGTFQLMDCRRIQSIDIEIHKVSRATYKLGRIVSRRRILLNNRTKVKLAIAHRMTQPGYYRVIVNGPTRYTSSLIQVMHQVRRGVTLPASRKLPGVNRRP